MEKNCLSDLTFLLNHGNLIFSYYVDDVGNKFDFALMVFLVDPIGLIYSYVVVC